MSKSIGGGLPHAAVGGRAEIMDLLDPVPARRAGAGARRVDVRRECSRARGWDRLHRAAHARGARAGPGDRGADAAAASTSIGEKYAIPLHATGFGHLFGMHWAPERVVDYRTRMLDDNEKIANICLGCSTRASTSISFGTLLLSAAHGDEEIDEFLAALERALHTVELAVNLRWIWN